LRREGKYSLSSAEVTTQSVLNKNPPLGTGRRVISSYESRLKELRSSHERELTEENDFIARLRKKAIDDRERLYHPEVIGETKN
jgi:hypothetical protein